jgi:acetoin utilization deacetylase AcuC-like enzyme
LINQEFQEKQQFENQIMKNDRINRYKREIEQQIKENEQKRNKLRNADKTGLNSTMGFHDSEIERKLCDSCEKTYPKKYMTRVKN